MSRIGSNNCESGCGQPVCGGEVHSLRILPYIDGGTVVEWAVRKDVLSPHTSTLQWSKAGVTDAEAWQNVVTVEDAYCAMDVHRRTYSRRDRTHYRVLVADPNGTVYASPAVATQTGLLTPVQQRTVRQIIASHRTAQRLGSYLSGVLLKQKHRGTPCSVCIDPSSGEPVRSYCLSCYDTGWVGGYYQPVPCFAISLSNYKSDLRTDDNRGTIEDGPEAQASFLNIPSVTAGDIWVDAANDQRWYLDDITTSVRVGNFEVLSTATAHLLPTTDVVYEIRINEGLR